MCYRPAWTARSALKHLLHCEKLALFYCFQFLYPHIKDELAAMAEGLKAARIDRGSLLDKNIQQWVFDYLERSP